MLIIVAALSVSHFRNLCISTAAPNLFPKYFPLQTVHIAGELLFDKSFHDDDGYDDDDDDVDGDF